MLHMRFLLKLNVMLQKPQVQILTQKFAILTGFHDFTQPYRVNVKMVSKLGHD